MLEVEHPTAKVNLVWIIVAISIVHLGLFIQFFFFLFWVFVEFAELQDREFGDGTTSVVIVPTDLKVELHTLFLPFYIPFYLQNKGSDH